MIRAPHACMLGAGIHVNQNWLCFLKNIRNETGGTKCALMHERSENQRMPRRSPDEQATFPILSSFLLGVLNFFDMQRIYPSRASKSAALLAAAMTGQIDIGCAR